MYALGIHISGNTCRIARLIAREQQMAKTKSSLAHRSGGFSDLKFDTSTYISLTPISTLSGRVLAKAVTKDSSGSTQIKAKTRAKK